APSTATAALSSTALIDIISILSTQPPLTQSIRHPLYGWNSLAPFTVCIALIAVVVIYAHTAPALRQ
ncbi:hypothetical protein FYZ35_02850, partial [Mobiluncus mulieris]|nr:hypothetical protein [Mobiluncus mulieris]